MDVDQDGTFEQFFKWCANHMGFYKPIDLIQLRFWDEGKKMSRWEGHEEVVARLCKNSCAKTYWTSDFEVTRPLELIITSECPIQITLRCRRKEGESKDKRSKEPRFYKAHLNQKPSMHSDVGFEWAADLQPGYEYRMVVEGKGEKAKKMRRKTCSMKLTTSWRINIEIKITLIAYDTKTLPTECNRAMPPKSTNQEEASFLRLKTIIFLASLFQMVIILLKVGLKVGWEWACNGLYPPYHTGILDLAFSFIYLLVCRLYESDRFAAAFARIYVLFDCTFQRNRLYSADGTRAIVAIPVWLKEEPGKVYTPWWVQNCVGTVEPVFDAAQKFIDRQATSREDMQEGRAKFPRLLWHTFEVRNADGKMECREIRKPQRSRPWAKMLMEEPSSSKLMETGNLAEVPLRLEEVLEVYEVLVGKNDQRTASALEEKMKNQIEEILSEIWPSQ
mmetsp:Transcript_4903/g.6472  ORF Transcript_4903/g.6472 Transcript_4903/m.6472 type:complete len:447 (-) Transcript_4903:279-1619(-)